MTIPTELCIFYFGVRTFFVHHEILMAQANEKNSMQLYTTINTLALKETHNRNHLI